MSSLRRWAGLGGVAFLVLYIIGMILEWSGPNSSSLAKMTAYYQDGGNRDHHHLGGLLAILGLICFMWFVGRVRDHVQRREDARVFYAPMVTLGGAVFVAGALVSTAIAEGIKTMSDDTYHHEVYPGVIHAANDVSYTALVFGAAVGLSMLILAVTVVSWRVFPRWFGWFGILAAIATIVSFLFFPMLIWLLWIATASILLFLRDSEADPTRMTTGS